MGMFYKAPKKELLEIRNKIFLTKGIPALEKKGFEKSPFLGAWYGRDNYKNFSYELCRLNANSQIEIINTYIIRGERWIQIHLNIFQLESKINSLSELKGVDGIQLGLPPNSVTEMRLWCDDGIPLFNCNFFRHKMKKSYTKCGLRKNIENFGKIIEEDMNNINFFVQKWHTMIPRTPLAQICKR
jgi:hypothetical protein